MSLKRYFEELIQRVESSDQITNAGRDQNGFFKPTKTVLLRNLNLLKDLHDRPLAKPMLKSAWAAVVNEVPPEWLILDEDDKKQLKQILGD